MNMSRDWISAARVQLDGKSLSTNGEDTVISLIELCEEKPDEALRVILEIVECDPSDDILNYLGAGPLEELLVKHCDYLEKVISKAQTEDRLKKALTHVNLEIEDCPNAQLLHEFVR